MLRGKIKKLIVLQNICIYISQLSRMFCQVAVSIETF